MDGSNSRDVGVASEMRGALEVPFDRIRNGLVVSCQAAPWHPMRSEDAIGRLAAAAELGGARGLRIEGVNDIRHVRARTRLPIIGLKKTQWGFGRPGITRSVPDCVEIAEAGADIVALEVVADEERSLDDALAVLREARAELMVPLLADISTFEEALEAMAAGADAVATTLVGYTSATRSKPAPDLELITRLHAAGIRVIAEGSVSTPALAGKAIRAGAWSVVVGTSITDPVRLTQNFARALDGRTGDTDIEQSSSRTEPEPLPEPLH